MGAVEWQQRGSFEEEKEATKLEQPPPAAVEQRQNKSA